MIKTLLVLTGALLLAAPAVQAQQHRYIPSRPAYNRAYAARGYGYGRYNHGRYYYFGGVPYFFPFDGFAFGFGYPYGAGYGYGYGAPYGYGYGPDGTDGAYEGRGTNDGNGSDRNAPPAPGSGPSLPQAVQRQLSKKGYYKGEIDGQFGPASRSALSNFQRDHNLRETGRIDEPTLDALGFTDHPAR